VYEPPALVVLLVYGMEGICILGRRRIAWDQGHYSKGTESCVLDCVERLQGLRWTSLPHDFKSGEY
jgi:hypothetical protein